MKRSRSKPAPQLRGRNSRRIVRSTLACKQHKPDRAHSEAERECKPRIPGIIDGDEVRPYPQCDTDNDEGPGEKPQDDKKHDEEKSSHVLQVTPSMSRHKWG